MAGADTASKGDGMDDNDHLDPFETALKRDLPRGLERQTLTPGRDRGLSSNWLRPKDMTGDAWESKDGLLLGRRAGRVIRWKDDRHVMTIAGSRAGKGVSLIIPNLIFYRGSAVVIDPKGENAARTANRRGLGVRGKDGLGQVVHVLDPFGETGLTSSAFNPLEGLKANHPDVIDDAGLFADALIIKDNMREPHWAESAQALIRALILLVVADPLFDKRKNLITVRQLLTLTDDAIDITIVRMKEKSEERAKDREQQKRRDGIEVSSDGEKISPSMRALIKLLRDVTNPDCDFVCHGMAEQLEAMSDKELGSILSTARTQTQWLDSPKMRDVLETSNKFKLEDLKLAKNGMTLYLCLPASRMATHSRWLRLMVMMALNTMERVPAQPKLPVLFVLDEFPVLGAMPSIEIAAGLMAGFGVKLWTIVQNLGQLKMHYPQSWETFVANSGVVTAFGVADSESLKAVTELLGQTGLVTKVDTGAPLTSRLGGTPSKKEDRSVVPLLAEHELRSVFARSKKRALVYTVEGDPAVVERFEYHAKEGRDFELFGGKYDEDPARSGAP